MASVPISYVNNNNNIVEVEIIAPYDDDAVVGVNISEIDIKDWWDTHGYSYGADLILSFRFKNTSTYDENPYLIFTVNGVETTVNTTKIQTGTYQFYFNLTVFEMYIDGSPILATQSIDGTNQNIENITNITISCGVLERSIATLPNTFGTIGVYEATETAIKQFLNDQNRFQTRIATYTTSYGEDVSIDQFNLSEYILRFYKSYIAFDFDKKDQNIILNGYTMSVKMNERTDLVAVFETDSINIEGFYKNSLDNDSFINIYIPLYNNYTLDAKYINHDIKFRYNCDIVNNYCNIEILIDGIVIDVVGCSLGYEIPLIKANVEVQAVKNNLLFINKNISININYYEKINGAYYSTDKTDIIDNFAGFIKAEDIYINDDNMTATEYNEIKSLFNSGVFYTK